jgi:hypothetical protein
MTGPYPNSGIGYTFSAVSNAQEGDVFLVSLKSIVHLMMR